jgi:hypothetical protein
MSIQYSFQQYIKAPRRPVFEALVDLDQIRKWTPNLLTVEHVSGPESDVGDRRKEVRKMFGREATEFIEITDMKKPGRLNMYIDGSEGTTGRGEFYFTYWLDEAGPQKAETKLTLECRIEQMGWFGSLLFKLFSGSFSRAMERDLDALAKHIESTNRAAA